MNRLSNKGQSLAIFVVFIPIFIMMGTFIVDMAFARYNKVKIDETSKMIIKYGLEKIGDDPYNDMVSLIYQNDDDIDDFKIDIDKENKKITMYVKKASKGFFSSLVGKDIYNQKSTFIGYIKDEKIIIEEVER